MEALSIIYQTVVTLKDIYDRVEGNKDACHHLIKMCVNLDAPLKALEKNENRLNASKEALRELSITVQSCLTFCRKYIGKRWFVKVWRLVKIGEQDRFEALEKSLTASMAELHLSVQVDSFVGIGDDLQEMKKHMGAMKTMLYEVLVQGGNLNDFQQSENPQAILANIMTNSEMLVSLAKEEDMLAPVGGLDQVNQRAQKKPRVFSGPILQINHSELTKSTGPNSLLGVGGFGSVYRCEYNGRPAAVKQFACLLEQAPDEADKRRIKREALIMQLASFHPNVIGFLGASVKQGMIVMELAPFSLHDLLFKENRQQLLSHLSAGDYSPDAVHSTRWKVSIMLDIARALSFIHFHGVLHRDIKSRNVMLVVDPNRFATTGLPLIAKVSDFGLALVVSTSSSGRSARSQMEGSGPVGSSAYMSPELLQYKGATAPSYTAGADIYAFGVLANELLTEREPWKGVPVTNIIGKVVNERLRPERFVPAGEQEELLVLSVIGDHEVGCLHHDPALRPTAAELCSERQLAGLRIAANGEPTTAEREMVMKKIEQTILEYGGDDAAAVGDEMSEFTDCDDADSEDQDLPPPAPQAANLSSNFASEHPGKFI